MVLVKCLGIKGKSWKQGVHCRGDCDPILVLLLNGHRTFDVLPSRSVPQFPQVRDGVRVPNAQGCREEETRYP